MNTKILMLLMMALISSSNGSKNLNCYTDGMSFITCTWDTSSVEYTPTTNCSLQCDYDYFTNLIKVQSPLKPQEDPQLRQATLTFENEALTEGDTHVQLNVLCENKQVEYKDFYISYCVKMYPPMKPVVNGRNITWQCGSPKLKSALTVMYEMQWGLLENSWEKNKEARTDNESCELPEDKLILGKEYRVRVRSTFKGTQEIWSEWSPVTKWKSTVGVELPSENPIIPGEFSIITSLGVIVGAAVVFLFFFCLQHHRRIIKCHYIPTPAKYFGELFSDHAGEFKSWLGPTGHEICIQTDSECISPVAVFKICNSDMPSKQREKAANIKDGNSSSFSNSIYFLSQSSKSRTTDQLEPCSADCPYGPAGEGSVQEKMLPAVHDNGSDSELSEVTMSTPLEMSSSSKQLQKLRLDIQSPDSGFAGSSGEQESQEESGSEGLPSPPVVVNTLPIHCNLQFPVPHLGMLPISLWNNLSGILEPSSDDYMPAKNV